MEVPVALEVVEVVAVAEEAVGAVDVAVEAGQLRLHQFLQRCGNWHMLDGSGELRRRLLRPGWVA